MQQCGPDGASREVPTGTHGGRHGLQAWHVAGMHYTATPHGLVPESVVRGRTPSPCLGFLVYKVGRLKPFPSEDCHED